MQLKVIIYSAILVSLASFSVAKSIKQGQSQGNQKQKVIKPPIYDPYDNPVDIGDINPPEPEPTAKPKIINTRRASFEMPLIPQQPPSDSNGPSTVMISDVIGKTRSINIFAGFTRQISSVSSLLDSSSQNSTILCPTNSALQALPRKPWEDPKDYNNIGSNAYAGDEGVDRAQRNLQRFVESHVVTEAPWGEGQKIKTMGGGEVWWEMKDGKKVVQPGGVEVDTVQEKVMNGEVWILKGVVNYAE